jgi:DNA-binding transcriptional LysR family regulator
VARCGSVSAAAKELGVSHATVLRRIDQFEKQLGVRLFKRLQSGYVISDAGEPLLRRVADIESELIDLLDLVQGRDEVPSGVLRVTQPQNVLLDLYPIYREFIQLYPDIQLEVETSSSIVNLNRQEAEVAIRLTEQPSELLVGRRVGSISVSAYMSKGYLAQFDGVPSLAELNWIFQPRSVNNWGGRSNNSGWEQLHRRVAAPRIVMQTSNYADIVSAIRAGIGASFLGDLYARQFDDLVPVPNCDIANSLNMWIVTHRDLRGVKRVQCFMRFVGDALAELLSGNCE